MMPMRLTVTIDESLLKQARTLTGLSWVAALASPRSSGCTLWSLDGSRSRSAARLGVEPG